MLNRQRSTSRNSSLLTEVQRKARTQRKSIRTERAYIKWITDFLYYQKEQTGDWIHPKEMSGDHVGQYLEYLAVDRKVAKSTQNQAMSALLFLFKQILGFDELNFDVARAKPSQKIPVVMSINEVSQIISVSRQEHPERHQTTRG